MGLIIFEVLGLLLGTVGSLAFLVPDVSSARRPNTLAQAGLLGSVRRQGRR